MKKEPLKRLFKENAFLSIIFWLVSLPIIIESCNILYEVYTKHHKISLIKESKHFLYLFLAVVVIYFFWKQILGLLKKIWEIKIVKYTVITVIVIALLNRTEQGKELLAKLVTWGAILGIIWLFLGKTLKKWFS